MKIIYIKEISSISESIFSFKSKSGVVSEPPFVCKEKPEKNRSSRYHLDKDDLAKIHIYYPEVHEYSRGFGLSKNEYATEMKHVLERIIRKGEFVQLLSKLYGTEISNTEIRWLSEDYSSDTVTWINIDLVTKVCTLHSDPACIYVVQKKGTSLKGIEVLRRDGGWLRFENEDQAAQFCLDQYSDFKRIAHC